MLSSQSVVLILKIELVQFKGFFLKTFNDYLSVHFDKKSLGTNVISDIIRWVLKFIQDLDPVESSLNDLNGIIKKLLDVILGCILILYELLALRIKSIAKVGIEIVTDNYVLL